MSNRVQRKSVFRKRLGRGGWRVGWLLGLHFTPRTSGHLPEFSSRVLFVQAVTLREGIGNQQRSSHHLQNYVSLRTESESKQRNESLQHFPVMKYIIKIKRLNQFFFLDPVKNLPSVKGKIPLQTTSYEMLFCTNHVKIQTNNALLHECALDMRWQERQRGAQR